ncbi:MAG: ubiquinone/menaquinone biosynthesis methyltransferase [Verrucomicrobia bacterium]|nr:ubiquinone/menaquinone biosynthesis methyltransferase [Verrucomicrobiota bacterium]
MERHIEQMFSHIARRYDRLNRLLSLGADRRWRARAVETLDGRRTPRVLDLCCGTGDLGIECLRHHEQAHVTFADFSTRMTELTGRKLAKTPAWAKRSDVVVGDGLKLPFPDRSFDAVLCGFGVRNMNSEAEGLIEIKRVLKSGGTCVILEFFRPVTWPARLFCWTFGTTLVPLAGLVVAGDFGAYRYLTRSILNHMRIDEFIFLMETIGFRRVEGVQLSAGIAGLVHGKLP